VGALARRGLGVIRVPLPARAENVAIHARINAEVVAAGKTSAQRMGSLLAQVLPGI